MKLVREQNIDNNEGVTELCQALPPAQHLLPWTETAKYSWPQNDCSDLEKNNKYQPNNKKWNFPKL